MNLPWTKEYVNAMNIKGEKGWDQNYYTLLPTTSFSNFTKSGLIYKFLTLMYLIYYLRYGLVSPKEMFKSRLTLQTRN